MLPALWLLILALGVLATALLPPQDASANTSLPGPCEDGYVAPTPVVVPVTSVPITVTSTTADYFVLYVKTGNLARKTTGPVFSATSTLPVSVTLGEDGTTTLADNLSPLPASRYRVEKYSVAQPGNVDGDCFDDLTELADLGTHNPVNPGRKVGKAHGAVAIDSLSTFQNLSLLGDWKLGDLDHLRNLEWVNYVIAKAHTDEPALHFINSSLGISHGAFHNATGVSSEPVYTRGSIVYHPNVKAPDGSLGIYRFSFDGLEPGDFEDVQKFNEVLAASMPVLNNNLFYYPTTDMQVYKYNLHKSKFDASRVKVLTQADILGDVDYIPMNQGEGYGRLRLMEEGERPSPFDIAIYKALPNDLPRVAGTITTVPQTPLSHVNLRAIQNNLPNAFIRDALTEETITALLDNYVYYAVTADGYTIRAATKADVDKHFESLRPKNTQTLQSDLTKKTITSLDNVSFADWTAFGVKAANVAELTKLALPDGTTPVGFAVPFYFYDEFMKQATLGKETILGKKKAPDEEKITLPAETTLAEAVAAMLAHSHFQTDADIQEEMLDDLRKAIKNATSPDWIITALENLHDQYPDGQSLRYRSSTNNEDLPSFSGAGLYSSKTQDPDETTEEGIDKSIKQVWASLWNYRAFLERDFHRVDHTTVVMGVLVHPNYSDETVNGVAVSYDPITFQDDAYYVNSQKGEDLVTNPEAHSQPEQLLLGTTGKVTILARSNLAPSDALLMSNSQMVQLRSNLETIHNHFKTLYGVKDGEDFAIEIEFKITAANKLAIKQARPWIFSEPLVLPKPEVTVALGSASATESETLELTATRSGGIQSTPLTVELSWSETKSMLPDSNPASVTIPSNQTSATISVPLDDDEEDEHESVVTVSIAVNDSYTIGTSGSASATVTDDDQTTIGVSAAAGTVTEGSPVIFNFTRSGSVLEQSLSVSITVTDSGSRLQGAAPTTATFAADSATTSISLPTANDGLWSAPSGVTVQIVSDSGYGIDGSGEALVTIKDDEPRPPTLLFDLNHKVPDGQIYHLNTDTADVSGDLTIFIDGPDKDHFIDYAELSTFVLLYSQRYSHPADANQDGVYELDLTAAASQGGSTTVRLRFTVVNDELESLAQQHWDQLSQDQRATLLPEAESGLLDPNFSDLIADVQASVLRLARQGLLPSPGPTISIAGGGDITEGGDATFTVTASPVPSAPLAVSVTVGQSGDFGVSTGSQTVTVPTSGSVSVTVGTTDDEVYEADGAVKATLDQGNGYVKSWPAGTATVAVADNDDPSPETPEISVTAGSGVTEGGDASFTVTASPVPSAPLSVSVTVGQGGDFGVSTGSRTVMVPTSGSVSVTVSTVDDSADETDGSVSVTVGAGDGYTVSSSQGLASVVVSDDDVPPPATPEVSVTAGSGVTEGGDASFTVTASPAPSAPLSVDVTVTQDGDFGVSVGSRTVTVPTSGSVSVTVSTVDDSTDETDGSVSVTVGAGDGYTVSSSQGSGSVSVADNDVPPPVTPEVSVTAGSGITEGGDASFTVTAAPVPSAPLSVSVTVGQSGDFGVSVGSRTVTVPTSGSVSVTVGTTDDDADETDGSVSVTVDAGDGYTVSSSQGSASVVVSDDDVSPPVTPEVSVTAGSGITEGGDASFTVSAVPAPNAPLSVDVSVSQVGDFGVSVGSQTVTVPTGGSVSVTVSTSDDSTDEVDGSVSVTVSASSGYTVSPTAGSASVVVSDDDVPLVLGCGDTDTLGLEARANHDGLANTLANRKERNDWWRAWIALSGVTGTFNTPLTAAEAKVLESGDGRWTRFRVALECLEGSPPPAIPVVSVTAGNGITEGADASFTVTANPVPSAPLSVDVTVAQTGDFGVTTGSRTVSVPTGGSVTVTVSTSDDDVDETDGSVTVTVNARSGYTVSSSAGSASVVVSDDDPPPVLACGDTDALGLEAKGNHDALPNTAANRKERNDWWRAWIALSGVTGTLNTPLTAAEALVLESGDLRWTRFRVALECLEGSPPTPVVSVTAGNGITEGGDASFTVTASPSPSSPLSVSVTVAQDGDFGATTGSQTVTVPTSGSATVTVSTSDDSTDETDGSVSVTVNAGSGYTVSSSQGSATVDVADNDVPPPVIPVVSVTAGSGVTEGGDASFTVAANPAPASPLSVSVTVAQDGDFGAATGSQTVTVPTSGSATVTVSTSDDSTDETDGSVSVTVNAGSGYTVSGTQGSASVNVADNDVPPPSTPEISIVSGSGIIEGGNASFTVTAFPAPSSALSVSVTVSQSGDFGASTGTRTVTVPTSGTATFAVSTTDDNTDETDGSVTVTVNALSGYTVSATQGSATVAVVDNDVPPPVTPEISIVSGSGIIEGGDASFTVTASPVPTAPLSVTVTVSQSGEYGATTGARTLTVPISGTATVTVGTTDDNTDEVDGSVTVTVNARSGYTVSATQGSASVNVADNDDPPPTDLPVVSVADGSVVEGEFGFLSLLEFQVTLSEPSEQDVTVRFRIGSGTAINGLDYWGSWGQVTIWAGWTRATTGVNVRDDRLRERDETLVIELTEADGAVIADNATATGTIIDND